MKIGQKIGEEGEGSGRKRDRVKQIYFISLTFILCPLFHVPYFMSLISCPLFHVPYFILLSYILDAERKEPARTETCTPS
jgi:hypothetical protein